MYLGLLLQCSALHSSYQRNSWQAEYEREHAHPLFSDSLKKTVFLFMAFLRLSSACIARLLYLALLFAHGLHAANYDPYCNSDIYGKPVSTECFNALSRFPMGDTAVRFFVEQQMRTAPPAATWDSFKDLRPPGHSQTIVQLPKWVSSGQLSFGTEPFRVFCLTNSRRYL